ncbi:MAG: response regulator transcription factor [Burkholderiales bacterium]|nr:response regulator transcription factor [Burkholderiales bacterium]
MPHPRILIIEDHPLMADAIAVSVQSCLPQAHFCFANSLATALTQLASPEPWVLVLVDLNLPDSLGLDTFNAVCQLRSQGAMLVLSESQDNAIEQACLANSVLFFNKALPSHAFITALLTALHQVMSDKPQVSLAQETSAPKGLQTLSAQQRLVLAQLAKGWTSRHIAQYLRLSEATVKSHTSEVLRKLGVENRTQATGLYLQWLQQLGSDA